MVPISSCCHSAKTANDPEEWYDFFNDRFNARAAVITCAVKNDLLIRTLVERRECSRLIELAIGPNESFNDDNLAKLAAQIERDRNPFEKWKAQFSPGIPELYYRLVALNGTSRILLLVCLALGR